MVAPKRAVFSDLQCNVESAFDGAGCGGSYKSRFLILGCSTSGLHHSWNNLVQNVINIFCTFLWHDFPLPELLYAIYQLLLVAWLDFRFQVELEFMPQVFDWVEVGLQFWLSLGGLVRHPEACTAIRLEGNRTLIAKNHVVESVSTLQNALRELQPLDFVGVTNQLAIGGLLQSPALLLSRSPYRG